MSAPAKAKSQRTLTTILVRSAQTGRVPSPRGGRRRGFPRARCSSVKQRGRTLGAPGRFVGGREGFQIARHRLAVVYPATQQVAAVDHVDGEPVLFVLV